MKKLHAWFYENQRELPWRQNPTPYKVWVSEVMLQQTRASVVIAYFEKWLQLFPDVQTLAQAPLEKVIKAWEGLGYYSRARNLHQGAIQIMRDFQGQIPDTKKDLESIQGLGPYTVGAILSFGFHKKAAAVDGNVTRVITRYKAIFENTSKVSTKRKIAQETEALLDERAPWVTMEALIELGATVCSPKPKCCLCPLQEQCLGQLKAEILPMKMKEKETTKLYRAVILVEGGDRILVKKGAKGKVMADLYEFPYFEMEKVLWPRKQILQTILKELGLKVDKLEKLKEVSHTFTRFKAHLYPFRCLLVDEPKEIEGYEWISQDQIKELPFSAGHRRILEL
jgi:A/G-specific adenine glycosylase